VVPRATVVWNEAKLRWMAWVRFPDGSRRKVERVVTRSASSGSNATRYRTCSYRSLGPPKSGRRSQSRRLDGSSSMPFRMTGILPCG
jgi:hypothetical protein